MKELCMSLSRRGLVLKFCLLWILLCSKVAYSATTPSKELSNITVESAVNGSTVLALKLYKRIALTGNDGNILFSPIGLTFAMGMARLGARGTTSRQIDRVLEWNPNGIRNELRQLNRILKGKENGVVFTIASSVWGDFSLNVRARYLKKMKTIYDSEFTRVNFAQKPEESRGKINNWAMRKTKNVILDMLHDNEILPSAKIALVNAVCFKAHWEIPFSIIRPSKFNAPVGNSGNPVRQIQVQMMGLMLDEHKYNYFNDEGSRCQVLEISYGGDLMSNPIDPRYTPTDTSMVMILPFKNHPLQELERGITVSKIKSWLAQLRPTNIDVSIPKFKIRRTFDAARYFQMLGVRNLFSDGRADLRSMTPDRGVSIRHVYQSSLLEVTEHGTDDGEVPDFVSIPILANPRKIFKADRPFIFFIYHKTTKAMILIGRIINPE